MEVEQLGLEFWEVKTAEMGAKLACFATTFNWTFL